MEQKKMKKNILHNCKKIKKNTKIEKKNGTRYNIKIRTTFECHMTFQWAGQTVDNNKPIHTGWVFLPGSSYNRDTWSIIEWKISHWLKCSNMSISLY